MFADKSATAYNPYLAVYLFWWFMSSIPFPLDQQIYELLSDEAFQQFTTLELRDAYAKHLKDDAFELDDLRYYVYSEIRRMMKVGWVARADGSIDGQPIYQLNPRPDGLKLVLTNSGFASSQAAAETESTAANTTEQLEAMHKELRLDFLAALGESERYKKIFDEMPHLRDTIEQAFSEAKDKSSRLLGHLQAVEQTLKAIAKTQ